MAINPEYFEDGVLHTVDERIQPEDYEKGLVGYIRINMDRLEGEFTDFLIQTSNADLDAELALFTVLEAIDQLMKQGEIDEHIAETIASLSWTIYDAMQHNQEVASD